MRYLRMLTNALAGGVLVALYLGVLVLQLNPQVPVVSITALAVVRRDDRVLRPLRREPHLLPDSDS